MVAINGALLTFALLDDGRSAVMRDDDVVDTYDTTDKNLGLALEAYFRLVESCGGARHPFEALDVAHHGHPHAG